MLLTLKAHAGFVNASNSDYAERPDSRPLTKFENRGLRLGHGVWDLLLKTKN
jgi:tRNA (guanine-N7-)-methyltransferase